MSERWVAERFPLRFRSHAGRLIHAGRLVRGRSWADAIIEPACGDVRPLQTSGGMTMPDEAITCRSCAKRLADRIVP